jgi:hypothetical protein
MQTTSQRLSPGHGIHAEQIQPKRTNMKTDFLKTAATKVIPTLLSTLVATLLIQACSTASTGVAAQTAANDPIEGLWSSQVTVTNCTSGATLRSFSALNLFIHGGTLTDTDSQIPTGHGPGFGTWKSTSTGSYASTIQFFRFNSDGSLAGSQTIARTITLNSAGSSFTSTLNVQVLDPTGAVLSTACGTETSTHEPQS